MTHAAMIALSVALSQTPDYTARTWIRASASRGVQPGPVNLGK